MHTGEEVSSEWVELPVMGEHDLGRTHQGEERDANKIFLEIAGKLML